MNYKLYYTEDAINDLTTIYRYIADDNIDTAIAFAEKIKLDIQDLALFPNIGVSVFDDIHGKSRRKKIFKNYIIYYVIEDDNVIIERIIHGARKSR